ncbi:AMP-binding protein [Paludibacterium yongneupense]|uniref:AMP-binding protein n=1 Tax=Paludibacterium yongneupense TaxID=400061 RepID=UPI00042605FD|nr:AMP-binding protein [Paludibacterium yongneupense]
MEKIWLDSYQHGVAHEIDVTAFTSICDVFNRSVQRFHDRPAMACMGTTLSYGELGSEVAAFSRYLVHDLGLARGDRVAVMMPNLLQYPIAVFGILAAGLTVVNVNPLYTPRELEHQLEDSGACAIVILENFAAVLQEVIAHTQIKHVIVASIGEMLRFPRGPIVDFVIRKVKKMVPPWSLPGHTRFRTALAAGRRRPELQIDVTREDIAFLQYTGGTTGVSKGAMLLHSNIIANMLQAGEWVRPVVHEGGEVIVTALPLYHIFSLTANLMIFTELGALNVLIPNPRDIAGFIKEMRNYPVTAITGVNTLFNALLNHPDFAALDFSTWRLALGGGMAVQGAVAERWKAVTGTTLVEAYGLTETSPAACINPLNLSDYNGSIGLPIPSTDIVLRDSNGHEVGPGESGELCIRGPQVMKGYWNRPDETARAIGPDGFLSTGDMATMLPGGFIKLVDRKKDMILVSGFNVYPNEVEDVVASLPGVMEVACIGVADDKSGEIVKIFVVRKDPALTADAIIAHCRHNLTGYKIPKQVEFRDELPKTNVGKILRRALREPQAGHHPA